MGGNGLAGTDGDTAIQNLIAFADDETAYDTTIYDSGAYFSRFFAANDTHTIAYSVEDIGITGDGTTTGTGCSEHRYCNSGVAESGFYIEQADNPTENALAFTLSSRFSASGSVVYDFSDVDGDLSDRNQYRYYSSRWRNPLGANEVCDLVGNCITPEITFRVVAGAADTTRSQLSVGTHALSSEGKMLANGTNAYSLAYTLSDQYENRVVPVRSAENPGNPIIKTVSSTLNFTNNLALNQLTNTPSGDKRVTITDLETDNTAGGG